MSPIHWLASNGPMPERLNFADVADPTEAQAGLHLAADVRFSGGLPDGEGPSAARPSNAVAVGIDSVDVPRLDAVLKRTPAMRERCFTSTELVDAATGGDEIGHLGICFAAKEAVAKALGCGIGPVGFHDVELVRGPTGAPELRVGGAAAPLADAAGIGGWLVSATHTATVAQTIVIAVSAAG